MKKIALIILIGILFPMAIAGQGETSNWYFGQGAGIHFNGDGSITPVTGGKLNTYEGCATISDINGNMLFYTDGITVFDRNHALMANGTGLFGDSSSSQSALIVPKPEDPSVFYIFTVDTSVSEDDPDHGLNYSVVDLSLNQGMGAVTQKNINLLADCSEKITAVIKDCFDHSIWVMTLASENGFEPYFNTFHAFEVNTEGVLKPAVKTTIAGDQITDPRGYLKLSSDGTKLASANATNGLYLYDFDAQTGRVTNGQWIKLSSTNANPYGIEFSPDNELLYVLSSNDVLTDTGSSADLVQLDLTAPDVADSMTLLHTGPFFRGALQQGENGKIYRTIAKSYREGTPYLGIIHDPNARGTKATYEHNAVYLAGNNATQGLPPFIQSFFVKTNLIRNEDGTSGSSLVLCSGDPFTLETAAAEGASYRWLKDGIPITTATGNRYELLSSRPGDSGRYRLEVTFADNMACPIIGEAQIKVIPEPESTIDLTQCDIDPAPTDGITTLNLEKLNASPDLEFTFYSSATDRDNGRAIANVNTYANTRPYNQSLYYTAVNELGCAYEGELHIQVVPGMLEQATSNSIQSCDENPEDGVLEGFFDLQALAGEYPDLDVKFYTSAENAGLEQNPVTDLFYSPSASMYARLQDGNHCRGIEAIELIVNPVPSFAMEESYVLCTDGSGLPLSAPDGFDSYQWYRQAGDPGEAFPESQQIVITAAGDYILEAGLRFNFNGETTNCTHLMAFKVLPSSRAAIKEIQIEDFAGNNTIRIAVAGEGKYEYSLDGANYRQDPFFEHLEPGLFMVYIKDLNGCGITQSQVAVMGYPKFFTPNGDGVNDYWQVTGLDRRFQADASISIYDRYGALVTSIEPGDTGWDGTIPAGSLPASDYWFSILLDDGREIKGHFALKR